MGRGTRRSFVPRSGWSEALANIPWQEPRLVVLVGLPGSGKSTWAQEAQERYGCQVVSADQVRRDLFGSLQKANSDRRNHARVFQIVHRDLRNHLQNGHSAIADATNLYPRARQPLYDLAKELDLPVEIVWFSNNDLARRQNLLREADAVVPEDVMQRLQALQIKIEEGSLHQIS